MVNTELGKLFWNNLDIIKGKRCPDKYWYQVCAEVGVNYQTFRGAKVRKALLNPTTLVALADYFKCDQMEFFAPPATNNVQGRRERVCQKIETISEDQLEMIERLLGLN